MQPNLERTTMAQTDAVVERPQTLIEKLELELANNSHKFNNWDNGFNAAIAIVKQHQSWRKISTSDEKPIDMQICNLLVDNESEESPTLYDIALFRKYKDEDVWLCMTRPEEHIDPSKILAWQPMGVPSDEFFESLQPPSEVQDD
jgi:hypothetical protein